MTPITFLVYFIAPSFILLFGVVINQFIKKYNKIDDFDIKFSNLIVKLEVLISKVDNHIDSHLYLNNSIEDRRINCDKKFEKIFRDIDKINDKL